MIDKTYPITEKLLKNGLDLSSKLLALLTKEASNLKNNADSSSITKIVNSKKEIVSQLNQFSKQFTQVLATEKLQMSSEGVAEYFKKAEKTALDTTASSDLWDEILSVSKKCLLLNEKNGASINLLAQHNQRTLNILKGKSEQPSTYGPDGSAYNEKLSHNLFSV
ncbi:MAG: flagellar protein FlgN [Methylococcales bacterium]|nr:flagellar protein FlgN [Methylococcales bacterium]